MQILKTPPKNTSKCCFMGKRNQNQTRPAMTKGFIALSFCHYSFSLIPLGDFIIAATHKEECVGKPARCEKKQ
jgi:hypothetical protein